MRSLDPYAYASLSRVFVSQGAHSHTHDDAGILIGRGSLGFRVISGSALRGILPMI